MSIKGYREARGGLIVVRDDTPGDRMLGYKRAG